MHLLFALACTGDRKNPGPDSEAPTSDDTAVSTSPQLDSLTIDPGQLRPKFAPPQLHYVVEADDVSGALATLTATAADADATVTFQHATIDWEAIDSGGSPFDAELAAGQRVDVVVEGTQGTTTYTVVVQPADFPEVAVMTATDEASTIYHFLANFPFGGPGPGFDPYLFVLDRKGIPVWYRGLESPALDFRPNANGVISYVTVYEGDATGVMLADDYSVARTVSPQPLQGTGAEVSTDHREFQVLDNGNVIALGTSLRRENMQSYGAPPGCCDVLDFVVQEIDPDDEVVFEWTTEGQFDYDIDLPPAMLDNIGNRWDYAHINSVEVDPADGNWILSSKFTSSVIKVARVATDFGDESYAQGEVIWRLGGTRSDFDIVGDDRAGGWEGFSDQHSARLTGANTLAVYDNASWPSIGDTGDSRYVEYELDYDAMTATKIAEYAIDGSGSTGICGSVQRLDNGNTIVGWGNLNSTYPDGPAVTEVDADGNVLFEVSLPTDQLSYRAFAGSWGEDGSWTLP